MKSTVHPRLRGELLLYPVTRLASLGSSPLTRGTQLTDLKKARFYRFIPAYAGNSNGTP